MELAGRVAVITGAAGGIGSALARRFAAEGAAALVLCDLDLDAVAALAAELPVATHAARVDVTVESDIAGLVAASVARFGRIDLFCSNAGITSGRGIEASAESWQRSWAV